MPCDILIKTTEEEATFEMKFAGKLPEGDSLSSIVSVTVTLHTDGGTGAVTASGEVISGSSVFARYTGGDTKMQYLVKITALTTNGDTLVNYGIIKVKDPSSPV